MTGTLSETYVAALQHDLADPPADAHLLGVIRRPPPWARPYLDDNEPALGPPPALLDDFREREADLAETGMGDEQAHNRAWDAVDYPERYRSYLADSDEAADALDRVASLVADGEDVVLVCFENTDDKHCHRTLLLDHLRDRLATGD